MHTFVHFTQLYVMRKEAGFILYLCEENTKNKIYSFRNKSNIRIQFGKKRWRPVPRKKRDSPIVLNCNSGNLVMKRYIVHLLVRLGFIIFFCLCGTLLSLLSHARWHWNGCLYLCKCFQHQIIKFFWILFTCHVTCVRTLVQCNVFHCF